MINIKVLFFANFRELLDCSSMSVELKADADIAELCDVIKEKGESWSSLFSNGESNVDTKVKVAVNQEMTTLEHSLKNGDEVAFFPPVTGG